MGETVPIAEVTRAFERYQDLALHAPVTVTKLGRPSVVILASSRRTSPETVRFSLSGGLT